MNPNQLSQILIKLLVFTIIISITTFLFLDWWVIPISEAFNYTYEFLNNSNYMELFAEQKATDLSNNLLADIESGVEIDDEYARNFWINAREEAGNSIHGFFLFLFAPWIATICMGYFAFKFSWKSSQKINKLILNYIGDKK